jgi:hypothetical protein
VDSHDHRGAAVPETLTAATLAEVPTGHFGVSRALDPELKRTLLECGRATEFPVLRGRTVVPDTWDGPVVFGHPNYLGVFEYSRERGGDVRLTGTWSALKTIPPDDVGVVVERAAPADRSVAALEAARLIAKRLRQLPGINVALRPQAPIVIALSPRRVRPDQPMLPGLTALGGEFPEYPGGYRIEIPDDVSGRDVLRYAADLEQRLAGEA